MERGEGLGESLQQLEVSDQMHLCDPRQEEPERGFRGFPASVVDAARRDFLLHQLNKEACVNPPHAPRASAWTLDVQFPASTVRETSGRVGDGPDPELHALTDRTEIGGHDAQLMGLDRPTELPAHRKVSEYHEDEGSHRNVATSVTGLDTCLLNKTNYPEDPTPALGCRGEKRTQWRPEEIDNRIANMLEKTMRGLAETLQNKHESEKRYKTVAPRFEGAETENPREFLRAVERYCRQENYHPEEWGLVATDQLRGDASRWFEPFKPLGLTFERISRALLEKYDNVVVRSHLQAKLYGKKQGREGAAVFISQKRALFQRLEVNLEEYHMVQQIRELLVPEVRITLRSAILNTFDELTQLATMVEADLQEIRLPIGRTPTATSNSVTRTPNQMNQLRITEGSNAANRRPLNSPPYPCRHCGGDHYNRDCPGSRAIEGPTARQAFAPTSTPSRGATSGLLPVSQHPLPGNGYRAAPTPSQASRPAQQ